MVTTAPPSRAAIRAHLLRTVVVLHEPDAVVELRVMGVRKHPKARPYTASGYFIDRERLVDEALTWDGKAPAVNITLNVVDQRLYARSPDEAKANPEHTTGDTGIQHRRWLFLDFDPTRPAGVSRTNEEYAAAKRAAAKVREWLTLVFGWPAPVEASSGNGIHLLWRIDLPSDDANRVASTTLVQHCLEAVALFANDDGVTVDTSTSNAARLVKFYGTLAAKGGATDDRPQRRSRHLAVPEPIQVVTVEQLSALAALAPRPTAGPSSSGSSGHTFDLERWIDRHRDRLGEVSGPHPWNGTGRKWRLACCPFNADHDDGKAYIAQHASGAISAGCLHASCRGENRWHDLRDAVEPGWRQQRDRAEHDQQNEHRASGARQSGARPSADQEVKGGGDNGGATSSTGSSKERWRPHVQNARELMGKQLPPVRWSVKDVIAEGLTLLAAKPKKGKTVLMVNISVSVAGGTKALGKLATSSGRVLYMALEDNERRMQRRLNKMLGPHDTIPEGLDLVYEWLPLDHGGLEALKTWLDEHRDTVMVVIDILERVRPRRKGNGNVYAEDYEATRELQRLASERQIAIVAIHHLRKGGAEDPMDEISSSTGLTGGVDNILVMRPMHGFMELSRRGRDYEDDSPLALRGDRERLVWTLEGNAEEVGRSRERREVLDTLGKVEGGMAPADLADALEKKPGTVRKLLFDMKQDGEVVKKDDGKYTPAAVGNGGNAGNGGNERNGSNAQPSQSEPASAAASPPKAEPTITPVTSVPGVTPVTTVTHNEGEQGRLALDTDEARCVVCGSVDIDRFDQYGRAFCAEHWTLPEATGDTPTVTADEVQ